MLAELQIKTSSSCNLRRCPLQNSMVCLHLEPGILNWFANYQDFGLQNLMLSYCKGIDVFFPVGSEYSPYVCAKSKAGVPYKERCIHVL